MIGLGQKLGLGLEHRWLFSKTLKACFIPLLAQIATRLRLFGRGRDLRSTLRIISLVSSIHCVDWQFRHFQIWLWLGRILLNKLWRRLRNPLNFLGAHDFFFKWFDFDVVLFADVWRFLHQNS